MSEHWSDKQLADQIASYVDGRLRHEEVAELEARLRSDDAALKLFARYTSLNADLAWSHRSAEMSQESGGSDQESARSSAPRTTKSFLDRTLKHHKTIGIAAAVVVSVGVISWMANTYVSGRIAGNGNVSPSETKQPEYVAFLNNEYDAAWVEGKPKYAHRPAMKPGHKLEIASGLIEVKYYTGARVVIEGPAVFYVGSQAAGDLASGGESGKAGSSLGRESVDGSENNSGFLKVGKLVARCETKVPKGFTVATPYAVFEDVSTEFGVEVGDRLTSLEVIQGSVYLASVRESGEVAPRQLVRAGYAADVHADGEVTTAAVAKTGAKGSGRFDFSWPSDPQDVPTDVIAEQPGADYVAFEAESGQPADHARSGWVVDGVAQPPIGASRGSYVVNTKHEKGKSPNPNNSLAYSINFPAVGAYTAYFRLAYTTDNFEHAGDHHANNDSLYYENGNVGSQSSFHMLDKPNRVGGGPGISNVEWRWFKGSAGDLVVQSTESRTWMIYGREDGMMIDRVVLSRQNDLGAAQLDELANSPLGKSETNIRN